MPIATQPRHDAMVNPTTHGLRRRRASEMAPSTGIAMTIKIDAAAFAIAYTRSVEPRSLTIQTEKYSVATFIEKIVFEKSYSAQLHRSTAGARTTGRISPSESTTGIACCGCPMGPLLESVVC